MLAMVLQIRMMPLCHPLQWRHTTWKPEYREDLGRESWAEERSPVVGKGEEPTVKEGVQVHREEQPIVYV